MITFFKYLHRGVRYTYNLFIVDYFNILMVEINYFSNLNSLGFDVGLNALKFLECRSRYKILALFNELIYKIVTFNIL